MKSFWIYGLHPVAHVLNNRMGDVERLLVNANSLAKLQEMVAKPSDLKSLSVNIAKSNSEFERKYPNVPHQNCLALVKSKEFLSIDELLIKISNHQSGKVIILDQINDPHNLGAIIRSAATFKLDGIILSERACPEINSDVVYKCASGGVEYLDIISVTNIAQTIQTLKKNDIWCFGLDEGGQNNISCLQSYDKIAIVMGSEGTGLRPLVRKNCDGIISINTNPQFPTLNVSNAAAIAMFALNCK